MRRTFRFLAALLMCALLALPAAGAKKIETKKVLVLDPMLELLVSFIGGPYVSVVSAQTWDARDRLVVSRARVTSAAAMQTPLIALDERQYAGFTGTGYDRLRQYLPGCNIVHSDLVYSIPAQTFTIQTDTTDLDLSDRGVSDLSFLMQMNNLNTLRLAGNGISSISPFQYTESWRTLTVLDLSRNSIIDPTPLTGLVNLTSLDLSYNQITNIMPLYVLRNLRELNLTGNPVSDDQIRDLNSILPYCFIIH